jgi:ABC-type multidrug transport system ATPase subunit
MSEEILKALMQLFAIILKQDSNVSLVQHKRVAAFLNQQISPDQVPEYLNLFEKFAEFDKNQNESGSEIEGTGKTKKLTSMVDSVRTLKICKKINKTLEQKQKTIVFARMLDMISADESVGELAQEIVETVGKVFKIKGQEYENIKGFVFDGGASHKSPQILVVDGINEEKQPLAGDELSGLGENDTDEEAQKHIYQEHFNGRLSFLKVNSVELYFLKTQTPNLIMNGLPIKAGQLYIFPSGSTIKESSGKPIYYSKIAATYLKDKIDANISFEASGIEYKFPNGNIGLRNINISEETGNLVGIMGASGAGKSTLLNILNGNDAPTSGKVLINGIDIHKDKENVEGVIGYVPQDDLLIDELTVYENLYYNGKLCLTNLSEQELDETIINLLRNLDLMSTKDLKVGNVLEKTISGGQRKRLNIGLELLREPSVLFVDEPTSGLSSRDSENIMDLLKELTLKGKIIFVVIHQPSSDIYKMFDKMFILDVGGYCVYYGNPVEALLYFKQKASQADQSDGECITCGNVNPELVFNILDAKLVDDYGRLLDKRKVSPKQWNGYFESEFVLDKVEQVNTPAPNSLFIPSKLIQWWVFVKRDILSKLKNTQYMMINSLEAPVLAFVLAMIVKNAVDSDTYNFYKNENIPAYIFMSIVVALFMGLTISAEEIIKDRRILKREKFLNLSKASYLFSKIGILFTFSAIQAFLFVLIGNNMLEIEGLGFSYWLVLFTVSCYANVVGLNISASFNSAVTIYILIPLILIPQMILSGAMFNFDKINKVLGEENKVPFLAEIMVSRWAFEALSVEQFRNNKFEKNQFLYHKLESDLNYRTAYFIPEIKSMSSQCIKLLKDDSDEANIEYVATLAIMKKAIKSENERLTVEEQFSKVNLLTPKDFDKQVAKDLKNYLKRLNTYYSEYFVQVSDLIESKREGLFGDEEYYQMKKKYANESLENIVRNTTSVKKVKDINGSLEQVIDPIFRSPKKGGFGLTAHFYSHMKKVPFTSLYMPTFTMNLLVIWLMSFIAFISLYFEWLRKLVIKLGRIKLPAVKIPFLNKVMQNLKGKFTKKEVETTDKEERLKKERIKKSKEKVHELKKELVEEIKNEKLQQIKDVAIEKEREDQAQKTTEEKDPVEKKRKEERQAAREERRIAREDKRMNK